MKRESKDRPHFENSERYCQRTAPFVLRKRKHRTEDTEDTEELNRTCRFQNVPPYQLAIGTILVIIAVPKLVLYEFEQRYFLWPVNFG